MEQSNKIERSEIWEQIYKVVCKLKVKEVEDNSIDVLSVTTELEKLFLKKFAVPVYIDPNEIRQDIPKSKEKLQQELFNKVKAIAELENKRNVFGC
jgi:hypothetical protein